METREQKIERLKKEKKKDNYYIPFPDRKLKSIFGLTDEEIEELHKVSKIS